MSAAEAIDAVNQLEPVRFSYRNDPTHEEQLGFIAEDVPALVATAERKGIQPFDVIAVLTRTVQQQQKQLAMLEQEISALKEQVTAHSRR